MSKSTDFSRAYWNLLEIEPLYVEYAVERADFINAAKHLEAENARLREALENERDAWTDTAEARDDDAWMRGFADQRIVAINKALGGTQ